MSKARILADMVGGGTTAAEFDYLDGVTSNIQTQFAAKAPIAGPTFTGTVAIPNVANLETAVVANTAKVSFTPDAAQVFNDSGADVDFRIESSGNENMFYVEAGANEVGIGTSNPMAMFDVAKGANGVTFRLGTFSANNSHDSGLIFQKSASDTINTMSATADDENLGQILFQGVGSNDQVATGARILVQQQGAAETDNCPSEMQFKVKRAGGGEAFWRIHNDGLLHFPFTSDSDYGTACIKMAWNTTDAGIYCFQNGTGIDSSNRGIIVNYDNDNDVNGAHYYTCQDAGGVIGRIEANGSATTQFVGSSDIRLKKDITDYTGGLSKIAELKPRNFKWKRNNKADIGFIAQELDEASTGTAVVSKGTDEWYGDLDENGDEINKHDILPWGTAYEKLVPILVSAIQELSAKVTVLESA